MSEDTALIARPEIVEAWVAGWALSRGLAAPISAYGGLRVEVGLPDQKARYVFADAGPGVRLAADEIREPHVLLKVCAAAGRVAPLLAESPHRTVEPFTARWAGGCTRPTPPRIGIEGAPFTWTARARAPDR